MKTTECTIRNFADLCARAGASTDTIESLGRRVYKDTDCGAWVEVIQPGWVQVGRRQAKVSILGMPSLKGWTAHAIRVNGRTVFDIGQRYTGRANSEHGTAQVDRRVPQEVLDYLQANEEVLRSCRKKVYTCDREASEVLHQTLRDQGGKGDGFTIDRFRAWERVRFDLPVAHLVWKKGGVRIGSIVEGADACTQTRELFFPFSEQAWQDALEGVEKEADWIWRETHGCDACGIEGEFGGNAINPECPECHGEGVVL